MLIDGVYQIEGNERVVSSKQAIPCGDLITTEYYHPVTGELLRRDGRVEVSEEFLIGSKTGV